MPSGYSLYSFCRYTTFGTQMSGRRLSSAKAKYGFNGKLKDNEDYGEGNAYDFGARIYDPRLGRWLGIDPEFKRFADATPYNYALNQVIIRIDPDGKYPIIVISTEVSGYTIARLAGKDVSQTFSTPAIVVPTYKAIMYDVDEKGTRKEIMTFNVIRDGWYSLGEVKDKDGVGTGSLKLINRAFEPANGAKNLYTGKGREFPKNSGLRAYNLSQKKSTSLKAEPLTTQKHIDGSPIEDGRTDNDVANGVMIHIGGNYDSQAAGWDWLATSYGCFGYIPTDDVYKTTEDAKKASDNDDNDDVTSNKEYKAMTNKVKELIQAEKKVDRQKLHIQVKKRNNYEKEKTIKKSEVLHE